VSKVGNFTKYLAAVVLGNVVYFSVLPYLPPVVRHGGFEIDWGLLVDAFFCLIAYALLDVFWPSRPRPRTGG
jgi:hypothetical protein